MIQNAFLSAKKTQINRIMGLQTCSDDKTWDYIETEEKMANCQIWNIAHEFKNINGVRLYFITN